MLKWQRMMWMLAAALGLTMAAEAVQPVVHASGDVIFVPRLGIALNARTGQLLWRFPRYEGQTLSDGHGLLIASWVTAIDVKYDRHVTRFCRLRTEDGHRLWCRNAVEVEQSVLDSRSRRWYVHNRGRLEVRSLADGQTERDFSVPYDQDLTLMPLPEGGTLLLERRRGATIEALVYRPGAAALEIEHLPGQLYPFRGDGQGLLLYARQRSEYYLAAPLHLLLREQRPPQAAFPDARLDAAGFVFTGWDRGQPVVRGGTYSGVIWQAPRTRDAPLLTLAGGAAVVVEADGQTTASQVRGWDLATGAPRFSIRLPGRYTRMAGDADAVLLQSESSVRLLDATSGATRWTVPQDPGALAAFAQSAIVFWQPDGEMVALARNNGALLWRVQMKPNRRR